jgi:hypothetical protein
MDQLVNKIDVDALLTALDALEPSMQQGKHAMFSKLYPSIVRALARNVPQKKIISELEQLGLKLHPTRFKTMLAAEAKALAERGNRVCCDRCGSVLGEAENNAQQEEAE